MHEDFISVTEVARLCRISRPTAIDRLDKGEIPGRKVIHGTPRVERAVFIKWLNSQPK